MRRYTARKKQTLKAIEFRMADMVADLITIGIAKINT